MFKNFLKKKKKNKISLKKEYTEQKNRDNG